MSGVKGMTLTGRLVEPPPGARKVQNFKLWMEEDGTPHGPYGPKATMTCGSSASPTMSATDEVGREFHVSVAQMVARAWLPPKPPKSKLVHLNGDPADNRASNLAWVPNKTNAQRCRSWKEKALAELKADPSHPRHGTMTGWRAGCKCQRCTAMGMAYRRILETRKTMREVERCLSRKEP